MTTDRIGDLKKIVIFHSGIPFFGWFCRKKWWFSMAKSAWKPEGHWRKWQHFGMVSLADDHVTETWEKNPNLLVDIGSHIAWELPSGKHTKGYWKLLFSSWIYPLIAWWFSIVMWLFTRGYSPIALIYIPTFVAQGLVDALLDSYITPSFTLRPHIWLLTIVSEFISQICIFVAT